MGKLICDFSKHPGEVKLDPASFAKVQKAVESHLAGVPVGGTYGAVGQTSSNWHITPVGPDWHISPTT